MARVEVIVCRVPCGEDAARLQHTTHLAEYPEEIVNGDVRKELEGKHDVKCLVRKGKICKGPPFEDDGSRTLGGYSCLSGGRSCQFEYPLVLVDAGYDAFRRKSGEAQGCGARPTLDVEETVRWLDARKEKARMAPDAPRINLGEHVLGQLCR